MVRYTIDTQENASRELVNVFSVFPAWIARNDGGATPAEEEGKRKLKNNQIPNEKSAIFFSTEKCSNSKREQWDTYNRCHQIDEPIRQKWCHTKK